MPETEGLWEEIMENGYTEEIDRLKLENAAHIEIEKTLVGVSESRRQEILRLDSCLYPIREVWEKHKELDYLLSEKEVGQVFHDLWKAVKEANHL
jgi:hypothetical protein